MTAQHYEEREEYVGQNDHHAPRFRRVKAARFVHIVGSPEERQHGDDGGVEPGEEQGNGHLSRRQPRFMLDWTFDGDKAFSTYHS